MTLVTKRFSDGQLAEGIRADGPPRRLCETILYDRYAYLIEVGRRQHRLSQDECQSAYSDTILSVISQVHRGCFADRSSLKTYLYRIYTHKCIDQLRTQSRKGSFYNQASLLDTSLLTVPDTVRSVIEELIAKYDVDQLHKRLQRLSARSREIILAWGEGYSDEEIAQQLGYRSAAVAKTIRLRRIRQLREVYHQRK